MSDGQPSIPIATLTKTKLNLQQSALIGISAVCTAVLLGAFTANFAILATGGLRIATTTAITPVAYFEFGESDSANTYIIKLTDQAKIDQARAILAGQETRAIHVMGTIVKQSAEFNPVWHTYLNPASITFFQSATEACMATIKAVEEGYDAIGGSFLPGYIWCPASSTLKKEVAYPSANNLARNKPVRNFLRDYAGTAKWTDRDEYNYKTFAEASGYTASKFTDGRWISLSSLAYGANFKYGFEIDLQQPTTINQLKLYWGHFGESPAIHEVGERNGKFYMQDYHVYAFTNNQWVQIAGKSVAPAERLTTVDLAAATTTSKLRVTSGVDANGNWTKETRNWIGVYEMEVYGPVPICNLESRTIIGYKSTAWEYNCAVSGIQTTYARTSLIGTIVETVSIPGCPSGYAATATAWKTDSSLLQKRYQCVYSCIPTGTPQQFDPSTSLNYYPADGGQFARLKQASPEDAKKVLLQRPLWQVNDVHYKEVRLGVWAKYNFYQKDVIVASTKDILAGQIVGAPERALTCK